MRRQLFSLVFFVGYPLYIVSEESAAVSTQTNLLMGVVWFFAFVQVVFTLKKAYEEGVDAV